ncbi:MAG: hypothetical protein GX595_04810, partial [Lentisphaerae bacterium]|nr:hypothetical protein [Lentisphaerota bacterium]
GHRGDYASTPAYLYVDGRGRMLRFEQAAGNGPGICRRLPGGDHEVLLYQGADCGFAVAAVDAVALDRDGKPMGPAALRRSRGYTYVVPVEGAFSYTLRGGKVEAGLALRCDRSEVIPGERVVVHGADAHPWQAPPTARPGERLWAEFEGAWIDFTVVPMTDTALRLEGDDLVLALRSHLADASEVEVAAFGQTARGALQPGRVSEIRLPLGAPTAEDAMLVPVVLRAGDLVQTLECGLRVLAAPLTVTVLPDGFVAGMGLRGEPERADFGTTSGHVLRRRTSCGDVAKEAIFMHPPWVGAVGYSFARFEDIALPAALPAAFRAVVGKADGSHLGDGIVYRVVVHDTAGRRTVVAEQAVTAHAWVPIAGDLTPWAGQRVALQLIADVGPADDSSGDWACWADLRIETLEPVLHRRLEDRPEALRREPGPHPLPGLTVEQCRRARRGWLRYDGIGFEGNSPTYGSTGVLNAVDLGVMAPAGGSERDGVWAEGVGVELTPAAIASLGRCNTFVLRNPRKDYFKVRRFWIELELADGRRASSDVSTAVFTQPPGWPHAEGILVPHGQDITVELWFRPVP